VTHQEKIDEAVKRLAEAIAQGNFRDAVASLIGASTTQGYRNGIDYAVTMMTGEYKDEFIERHKAG